MRLGHTGDARAMLQYCLKRLCVALLTAFAVSILNFVLLLAAADPASALAGAATSAAQIQDIRAQYGLDQPMGLQYLHWLGGVLSGDLGQSYYFKTPVAEILRERLPVTLTLGALSIGAALLFSIPLGVAAAAHAGRLTDRLVLAAAAAGQAIPSFWLALMLVVLFSLTLRLLPPSGSAGWLNFVMPTIVMAVYTAPVLIRLTRAGMLDALNSDYVRTARAKGAPALRIFFVHALRNAIIPVVSLSAVQFGFMLGGSVVIETVFALNGTGYLAWEAISRADIPVIQALLLFFSLSYIVLTLCADLLNAWLDPRLRGA